MALSTLTSKLKTLGKTAYYKYVSKGKKYVISGVGLASVLTMFFYLAGGTFTTSGDITCADMCVSYINYTNSIYAIQLVNISDPQFGAYFDKALKSYQIFLKVRGVWTQNVTNETWNAGTPIEFKLIGKKEPRDTIKWGFKVGSANIDPIWNGEPRFYKGNSLFSVDTNLMIFDTYGVSYTPQCFDECHLPIEIKYNGSVMPASIKFKPQNLSWILDRIGGDDIDIVGIRYLNTSNDTQDVWVPNVTCSPYIVFMNETPTEFTNCTDNGHYDQINVTMGNWMDLPSSLTFLKNRYYQIDIIGKRTPKLGNYATDVKPSIMGLSFDQMAWWNTSWTNCRNITIDKSKVGGALTNFPMLVILDNSTGNFSSSNQWKDLRFVNSSCGTNGGSIALPYEIDHNETTKWTGWVRVDSLDNVNNRVISVYYNNSEATSGENRTGTWSSKYMSVYHMKDDNSTLYVNDSTSNGNNCTKLGAGQPVENLTGFIDRAQRFDGSNDILSCGDAVYNDVANISTEFWTYYFNVAGDIGGFISKGKSPCVLGQDWGMAYFWGTNQATREPSVGAYGLIGANMQYGTKYQDAWIYYAGTWAFNATSTTCNAYYNGLLNATAKVSGNVTTPAGYQLQLGHGTYCDVNYYGNIMMDEVRILNVVETSAYYLTSYNSMYSPSTFYSMGDMENYTAPAVAGAILVYLNYPLNNAWNASRTINHNAKYTDSVEVNCSLWTNETSWSLKHSNTSALANNTAFTIQEVYGIDSIFLWNMECCNSTGTCVMNATNWTIKIDSTAPIPIIVVPANTSYNNNPQLNFSYTEANPVRCWYSINGTANVTLATCTTNGTIMASGEGGNNVRLCMNDTANNTGCAKTYWTKDTIAPKWSLNSTTARTCGGYVNHSLYWNDTNLSGYIFSFCNGTWNGTGCLPLSFGTQVCYQESANTTNQTGIDGNCGLFYNGNYSFDINWSIPASAVDGIWISGTSAKTNSSATLYINYTKPLNALPTSIWQIKDDSIVNLTIPSNCWNQNPLQFSVNSTYFQNPSLLTINWSCYNGTDWQSLRNYNNVVIYEEAMWWYISEFDARINDTWIPMTGTLNWSNVTKSVNTTNGARIAWCVSANDSANKWNYSSCENPFSYTVSNPLNLYLNGADSDNYYEYGTNASLNCSNICSIPINLTCFGTIGTGNTTWNADAVQCATQNGTTMTFKAFTNNNFNIPIIKPADIDSIKLTLSANETVRNLFLQFNGSTIIYLPGELQGTTMTSKNISTGGVENPLINVTLNKFNTTFVTISVGLNYTQAAINFTGYLNTTETDLEIAGSGTCGGTVTSCSNAFDENWTTSATVFPTCTAYPSCCRSGVIYEEYLIPAASEIWWTGLFQGYKNLNNQLLVYAYNYTNATPYWVEMINTTLGGPTNPQAYEYFNISLDNYPDFVVNSRLKIYVSLIPTCGNPVDTGVGMAFYEGKVNYSAYPDLYVDFGKDGKWDWNTTNLISDTKVNFNVSAINTKECGFTGGCSFPIYMYSSRGNVTITVKNVSFVATTANISVDDWNVSIGGINKTGIKRYVDQYGNLSYVLTPWSANAVSDNSSYGYFTLSGINITYKGSQDYNVSCSYGLNSTSHTLHVEYSNITVTFPNTVHFNTFVAVNTTQYNITPYGQTSSQWSMNITTWHPTENENVSIYFNTTLPNCMNVTFSITGNKTDGVRMNNYSNSSRWIPITNSARNNSTKFWFWTDLNPLCNATWYDEFAIVEPICYKCVRDW